MTKTYVIGCIRRPTGSEPLYWSNVDGWVDLSSATVFNEGEMVNLPINGVVVSSDEANKAKMMNTPITRLNINELLDRGRIEAHQGGGRWWAIRRNGKTQCWKRDSNRIRIPVKAGFRTCGAITEADFLYDDNRQLDPRLYRVRA